MTFDTRGHTMMGVSPEDAVTSLAAWGADAIGGNCGNGPDELIPVIAKMHAAAPDVVLVAKSNAGMPELVDMQAVYRASPELMAGTALEMRDAGARIVGACCGSTPDHLRAMAAALVASDRRLTRVARPLKVGIQLPEVEREVRWPELLDMVRAIEDLGFDSVWVGEHLLYRWPEREPRGPWEAWTLMAAIAASTIAGRVRAARRLHQLPQPGAARQAGRHDRRDQRRPVRPGPGRRLERDRVPRVRLPVRPPDRPLRGGVHDHPDAPARGRHRLRRALLPGPRLRAVAARPAPGGPPLMIGSKGARMLAMTLPHVDVVERLVLRHRQRARPGSPPLRDLVDARAGDVGRDPADDRADRGGAWSACPGGDRAPAGWVRRGQVPAAGGPPGA